MSDTSSYFRGSEDVSCGQTKESEHFFLRKGCHITTFIRRPRNCRVITWVNKRLVNNFYICRIYWFRFLSIQSLNSLSGSPVLVAGQELAGTKPGRVSVILSIVRMKGICFSGIP